MKGTTIQANPSDALRWKYPCVLIFIPYLRKQFQPSKEKLASTTVGDDWADEKLLVKRQRKTNRPRLAATQRMLVIYSHCLLNKPLHMHKTNAIHFVRRFLHLSSSMYLLEHAGINLLHNSFWVSSTTSGWRSVCAKCGWSCEAANDAWNV